MIGCPFLPPGMQNGGIQHSTMLLPWSELVSSVSLTPCPSLDGMSFVSLQEIVALLFMSDSI